MPFTGVGTYAMAIVVAILSAFVLSGAPGGGLVGEMLIVSFFGFLGEAFQQLLPLGFGWIQQAATCLNSSGDTVASMIVARLGGRQGLMLKREKKKIK